MKHYNGNVEQDQAQRKRLHSPQTSTLSLSHFHTFTFKLSHFRTFTFKLSHFHFQTFKLSPDYSNGERDQGLHPRQHSLQPPAWKTPSTEPKKNLKQKLKK